MPQFAALDRKKDGADTVEPVELLPDGKHDQVLRKDKSSDRNILIFGGKRPVKI
jgi:hypothetical protein